MRAGGLQIIFACVFAAVALSGCAANSFMGIPLAERVATAEQAGLQALAVRARAGNKQAQLELASRFERGEGVPMDRAKADRLMAMARTPVGGQSTIFVPAA